METDFPEPRPPFFYVEDISAPGHRYSYTDPDTGEELARCRVYFPHNDLHAEPFALVEDLFVHQSQRGKGVAKALMRQLIADAKRHGCYKVIANSRKTRLEVHALYEKLGFRDHGKEFYLDLRQPG